MFSKYIPNKKLSHPNMKHHSQGYLEYSGEKKLILDTYTIYRGGFGSRYDFVSTYLLASIGLKNVAHFPRLAYKHGGAAFIIMYVCLSLAFGIPMFIIETGLSQFYSMGEAKLFGIVPYFRGLGWSIHILNLLAIIPYCITIQWYVNYLIYSLLPIKSPWSKCIEVPGVLCLDVYQIAKKNTTKLEMHSSRMYFEFEVKGSRKMSDGTYFNFENSLGHIRFHQLLQLAALWIIILILTWSIIKMYSKINYLLLSTAGGILLTLTVKSLFLTGGLSGVSKFLNPDLEKLFTGESLRGAIIHIMFSLCITKSCSTFASLNSFKFNFIKASMFIVLGDFYFSLISGLLIFSTLGFLSRKLDTDINILVENELIFENYIDASIINSETKVWVFLFMLMIVILGFTTISAICSACTMSVVDFFPNFMYLSEMKKLIISAIICGLLAFLSTFFTLEGSCIYLDIFLKRSDDICTPLMILSEVVLVQFLYGAKRLRLEIKMMVGYTYNIIWVFFSVTLVPLLIIFVLVYTLYAEYAVEAPMWAQILTYLITYLPLLPLIVYFLLQFRTNYREQKGLNIMTVGITTPEIYGPYYKRYWLLSRYYQKKLVKNRKNPEFLKTIRETENLAEVLQNLRTLYMKLNEVKNKPNK